ncbi:DUF3299 domain-containing protein [Vibrio sp. SCSIO 43135]|uniref:DUF3299 domain-containing protein n=1 Tax=Vibrio sp. SCSIO 43135 TaxID=2819096 RepID=UPI002075ADC1|nr:DUF3299 domain-containing protein [Vibrio sp. SCSIO 43135]USD44201.1 DUF3299 domain-containing protein [Vibrio sp. SCSIO 43135]
MLRKFLVLLLFTPAISWADSSQLLEWVDLIPQEVRAAQQAAIDIEINHNSVTAQPLADAKLRDDLNNQQIAISGFVIPLEGDSEVVTEFLLVPYFGACIHVPPPPQNQIIYVKDTKGVSITQLWDVVTVSGTITTNSVSHDLAQVGYSMQDIQVEPYGDPDTI